MNTEQMAGLFSQVVPASSIVSDPVSLRVYECDGLSAYRQSPKLVVLPENTEQVQATMAVCKTMLFPLSVEVGERVCPGVLCPMRMELS